jgi:steroid delta-isomerase-like uncharacterized protein
MAKDWIERYLDAWNSYDASQVGAFMAEDATYEDLGLGVTHQGRDAITAFVDETVDFSDDYRFELVSAQTTGDRYAAEWIMSGTNTGEGGGMPATNKPFSIRGVSVGRLNGAGAIVENRDYWNLADYLTQVGILPPPTGD